MYTHIYRGESGVCIHIQLNISIYVYTLLQCVSKNATPYHKSIRLCNTRSLAFSLLKHSVDRHTIMYAHTMYSHTMHTICIHTHARIYDAHARIPALSCSPVHFHALSFPVSLSVTIAFSLAVHIAHHLLLAHVHTDGVDRT